MAKSLLQMRRKKTVRVSRSETYLINQKYLGEEPVAKSDDVIENVDYNRYLTWYNYMCDKNDARTYLKDYLKNTARTAEAKQVDQVPDVWVPLTAAWIARLISRGFKLPESSKTFFEQKLKESITKIKVADPTESHTAGLSIQDRMREKTHDIIGEIEEMIDKGEKFSLYDWLKGQSIPAMYAPKIAEKYTPWRDELEEALNRPDAQLKEAYSHLSKPELRAKLAFMNELIADAEKYAGVAKKTRAPRKPRPMSVEKQLKNLKYQKESKEYKVASVNPEKILGAQELWCFNTKYRTITVFRALDRGGLKVNRTSITGYDEKTSMTRGTGRQTEKVVEKIMTGGKIILRKVMDELKGNQALQERINENTILLKVVA